MRLAFVIGLCALTSVNIALASGEKRSLEAHEHGVGKLNIAFEEGQIAMELEAPGADIVGFEYHADSAEDRQKIDAAIAILAKPLDIFALPDSAKCQVKEANVELNGDDEDNHEKHAADAIHDEHADGKHEDHANAKHEEYHGEEEAGHTEFRAEYLLVCANPAAVTRIEFPYFSTFPNAEELEVQMISDKGSTAFEVERDKPRIDLSGMI